MVNVASMMVYYLKGRTVEATAVQLPNMEVKNQRKVSETSCFPL